MKKFTRILLVVCVVIWVLACAGSYVFLFISALLDLSLGTLFSVSLGLVIGSVLVLLLYKSGFPANSSLLHFSVFTLQSISTCHEYTSFFQR